jgi:uncharacterized protein
MSPLHLAAASATVALGAVVQGSVGFGLNIVAAPLLVLIDTSLVPGPALAAALFLVVLMTRREQSAIDYSGLGWLLAGRMPATIGAALLVAVLPQDATALAVGSAVLLGVVLSLLGWRMRRVPATYLAVGAASGAMGTLTSVGGPPLALLYQDARGPVLRGTLSAIFVIGSMISLLALAAVGSFGRAELGASLALAPGILTGFIISRWTARVADRRALRPFLLGVSSIAASAAILRGAF